MANDNLSNLPWEDPDYRAELDRSLMAYGAYLSRTELAVASTSRSLGEFDMPQDWYLLKDENSILDATGESGAFAVAFVNDNHNKLDIAYCGSGGREDIEAIRPPWVVGKTRAALGVTPGTQKGQHARPE